MMYTLCKTTGHRTIRNFVISSYAFWTNGCCRSHSIASSVVQSRLFETPTSNNKCIYLQSLWQWSHCHLHPGHTVTTIRKLSKSHVCQALVKQGAVVPGYEKTGLFTRTLEYIGIVGRLRFNRFKIRVASQNMYGSCVDGVNVQDFFKACNMADTLFSWFLVTQLHVWMSMVRLRQEGREGKYMIHYLVHCMWHDLQARGKEMGISSVKLKEGTKEMVAQFNAALFAYDEGILSDDRVLASALWRTIFLKKCDDPEHLAYMVEYVRKQIQYLETLDSTQLFKRGRVKWISFQPDIPVCTGELRQPATLDKEQASKSQVKQTKL